jgi:hypothetical protein
MARTERTQTGPSDGRPLGQVRGSSSRSASSDSQGAAFVGGGDEPEQQLGDGVGEGGEPDFVDQDEVVAEQGLDHLPDAVVGQAAVGGVGQVGRGEVADLAPGADGGDAEGDQGVAFAGAARVDQAQVLGGR